MSAVLDPVTQRVKAGKCPVCRSLLWADVDVVREVSEPRFGAENSAMSLPTAHVFCRPVAMRLSHECSAADGGAD